jgi:hypothetical protein
MTVEQAFQAAGYTTLAFNFRGVGGSEGTYGEGRAEIADVIGALEFLEQVVESRSLRLAVAGYSFGCYVGAMATVADPRVQFFLGVAPPLTRYDLRTLRHAVCRVALIGATLDEFCPRPMFEELFFSLPATPWTRLLDTDHGFTDALDALALGCRDAIAWEDPSA